MTRQSFRHGSRYGYWTALERRGSDRFGNAVDFCRCDCGTEKLVLRSTLLSGNSKSCGCKKGDLLRSSTYRPPRDLRKAKLRKVHWNMVSRCHKEDHPYYAWYGARGIRVCERWHDFMNFYIDMGYPQPGQTIERIDNARGYEPGNCTWATMKEQARNKRNVLTLEYAGKKWCPTDLAHEYGMNPQTLIRRIRSGLSASEAISKPVKSVGNRTYRRRK